MAGEALSEKVSVNMNTSTLSSIDLLVDNGYYSNRSDFINQAVRMAIAQHQSTIDRIVQTNSSKEKGNGWFIGVAGLTKTEIEELCLAGETMTIKGYGVFVIDEDCDREKLFAAVKSISVRGKVIAPADVKQYYGIK